MNKQAFQSWIESQSSTLRLPDLNMLMEFYLTSPNDDEIRSLTTGLLGDSKVIQKFLSELMIRRHSCGISSVKPKNDPTPNPEFPSLSSSQPITEITKPSSLSTAKPQRAAPTVRNPSTIVPDYQYGSEEAKPIPLTKDEIALQEHEFPNLPSKDEPPTTQASTSRGPETIVSQLGPAVTSRIRVVNKKQKSRKTVTSTTPSLTAGREVCLCMCTQHNLVANCTVCGRIVCEQEGEGPCFFCGSYVRRDHTVPNDEFVTTMQGATLYAGGYNLDRNKVFETAITTSTVPEKIEQPDDVNTQLKSASGSISSIAIRDKSVYNVSSRGKSNEDRVAMGLAAATSFRDRLLERARATGHKPNIIDEQSDFYEFEGNVWMDKKEKEEKEERARLAAEAVEELRHEYTLDLDLENMKVGTTGYKAEMDFAGSGMVGELKDTLDERVDKMLRTQQKKKMEDVEASNAVNVVADSKKTYSMYQQGGYIRNTQQSSSSLSASGVSSSTNTQGNRSSSKPSDFSQVFRNDTLDGRARMVYESMRRLIKNSTHTVDKLNSDQFPTRRVQWEGIGESSGVDAYEGVDDVDGSTVGSCDNVKWGTIGGGVGMCGIGDDIFGDIDGQFDYQLDHTTSNSGNSNSDEIRESELGSWSCAVTPLSTTPSTITSISSTANRWLGGASHLGYVPMEDLAIASTSDDKNSTMTDAARDVTRALLGGFISANYIQKGYGDAGDSGMCLSMHQPWASLLVYGIKRFEGRGWSSGYRGRLWVASTARRTDDDEIASLEQQYKDVYGENNKLQWPKTYPSAALLGCVDMVGCWTRDEFNDYYEKRKCEVKVESNESMNVFVCTNPRVLPMPINITGQHKLWQIPLNIHKGLSENLKPVNNILNAFIQEKTSVIGLGETLIELKPKKKR